MKISKHDVEVDGKPYHNTYLFINDRIDQYHDYGVYLQILLTKHGEILDCGFYLERDIDIGGMYQ